MRHKFLLYSFYFLVVFHVGKIACGTSSCPKPSVKKRTIIQSRASIKRGAKLIGEDIVDSARDCYKLCCNDLTCDTAIMFYKQKDNELGEPITEKKCYLFSCGSPSVCTYEAHHRYAIIDLSSREQEIQEAKSVSTEEPTSSPPTTTKTTTSTATATFTTTTSTQPPQATTIGVTRFLSTKASPTIKSATRGKVDETGVEVVLDLHDMWFDSVNHPLKLYTSQ